MTNKRFALLSFIMLLLFAVLAAGGCGGSSSSSSDSGSSQADSAELPGILSLQGTEEYNRVMAELKTELSAEGVDVDDNGNRGANGDEGPTVHFVLIDETGHAHINKDTATASATAAGIVKSAATLLPEEMARVAAELKPEYESGDVIALMFPSPETINDLYEALDEQPSYFSGLSESESSDLYPEIYAIAKRPGTKSTHYFSYEVPGSKALLVGVLAENVSSGDGIPDPDDGIDDYSGTTTQDESLSLRLEYMFQARRYAAFMKWVALLDKKAAQLDAESESVQASFSFTASDTSSGNFITFNSQNVEKDASYYRAGYLPWNQERYRHDVSYASGASYTIYSAHNFSDGDDYYLVKANGFSTPRNYWHGTNGGWENCHFGQTSDFNFETTINGATTADAYAIQTAPKSVAYNGSVTDGISQTIGGKVGANAGVSDKGPSAGVNTEISASLTYSHSKTWSISEWRLNNQSGALAAKWDADFDREDGRYLADYSTGNIPGAGKARVDLDTEWMWRVRKSYWRNHSTIPIKLSIQTWTGFTLWEYHWYKSNENESWEYGLTQYRYFNMNRPPHVYVTQKSFTFAPEGGSNEFKLLCNSDYTITSSQSWCQISSSQRTGGDTGANERTIMFGVDPYTTSSSTFQTRTATITVRENSTGDTQTITVTQRNR
ncbi:MAG: BACON domain-containing protein [Synergistaceae bacterium]|nr:BACON domain-containing protein [Synergistaceae bacterium]